jgi:hypothetical protein
VGIPGAALFQVSGDHLGSRSCGRGQLRQAERYDCLTAGEDYEIMMRSVRRGLVTVDEALNEATFIVRSCWADIMKLGTHLQTHHELTFREISTLLDLGNGRCIYGESNRPNVRRGPLSDV